MPLEKGKSKAAFEHNVKAELSAKKPLKQALAISYAEKRKNDIENISETKKNPVESNAGKYTGVKAANFAGPDGTYPINTLKRAKSALSYAHNSPNPSLIKEKVYKKYPTLEERKKEREKSDNKRWSMYDAHKYN